MFPSTLARITPRTSLPPSWPGRGEPDLPAVVRAISIAAGHPTRLPSPLHSRGGDGAARPVNREPHLLLQKA